MKTFKTIDYYVQVFLISAALVVNLALAAGNRANFDTLSLGYFFVGGWQVCSVIVNFMVPAAYKIKARMIYLVLLIVTVLAGLMCLQFNDAVLVFLFVLLFWSPVLAIFYVITCYRELKLLKQEVA